MSEKFNNKTCGECHWFNKKGNNCHLHNNQYIFGDRSACKDFGQIPKPTNGDKIDRIINLAKHLHDDLQGVLDVRVLRRISDIYATAKEIKEAKDE